VSPYEYFRRYQQKRTADEELRDTMRRKAVIFRWPREAVSVLSALRTPFNCTEVAALLALAGTCCIVLLIVVAGICAGVSALLSIPLWIAVVIYATPFALCVAVYTAVLRHSAWFFRLHPPLRWTASLVSAIVLTCLLVGALNLFVLSLI